MKSSTMHHGSRARILLVDDVAMEAKLLLRLLADAGYSNVVYKSDVQSALAEIEASNPRLVLTDYELGGLSGVDLTKKIRGSSRSEYTYIMMLTSHGAGPKLTAAFEAGVDDFVTKPYGREEFLARVHAGLRVVDLESRLRRRSNELEIALRRIDVAAAQRALAAAAAPASDETAERNSTAESIAGTTAWRAVGDSHAKMLGEFFQVPFQAAATPTIPTNPYVASITLSDPSRELEVYGAVLVDPTSKKNLATHLLGEEDDDAAKALVLEVANTAAGDLKAKLNALGYAFVSGLPKETTVELARKELDDSPVRVRSTLTSADAGVHIWLRASSKGNSKVRVGSLREGMVLSSDVKTESGMLLLRGGTRLTESAIERLRKMTPELEVEVSVQTAA